MKLSAQPKYLTLGLLVSLIGALLISLISVSVGAGVLPPQIKGKKPKHEEKSHVLHALLSNDERLEPGNFIIFRFGWWAKSTDDKSGKEYVEDFLQNTNMTFELDGKEVKNPESYYGSIEEGEYKGEKVYGVSWALPSSPMGVGTHTWTIEIRFTKTVKDGAGNTFKKGGTLANKGELNVVRGKASKPSQEDLWVPGEAVPVMTEWDQDGLKDLIAGGDDGTVTYFKRLRKKEPVFLPGEKLETVNGVPLENILVEDGYPAVESHPEVVDWNEDGKKDLLVGNDAGYLHLFINTNKNKNKKPLLKHEGKLRFQNGDPIQVGWEAAPRIVDWNADGKKDLLLGAMHNLQVLINEGTNSAPEFAGFKDVGDFSVPPFGDGGAWAPAVGKWNEDGRFDLLIGVSLWWKGEEGEGNFDPVGGPVFKYINTGSPGDPSFSEGERVELKNGDYLDVGDSAAPNIVDWTGDNLQDLVVGNNSGFIFFYKRVVTKDGLQLRKVESYVTERPGRPRARKANLNQNLMLDELHASPNPVVSEETVEFAVTGKGVEKTRLQVFNSQGETIYDSGFAAGQSLAWDLSTQKGHGLANGLYLYRMIVKGNGSTHTSSIKRLLIVR